MANLNHRPTQSLVHYCSVDSFRAILSSKQIRMSELTGLNDPREITFGREKALIAIAELLNSASDPSIIGYLIRLRENIESFYEAANMFTTCFSILPDALPMWNLYAETCQGVAIGFRPRAIIDMHGMLQKVVYANDIDYSMVSETLSAIATSFSCSRQGLDSFLGVDAVGRGLALVSAFKHETWQHEQEVRLIYTQPKAHSDSRSPMAGRTDGTLHFWQPPSLRMRGSNQVPYLDMPFGKWVDRKHDPSQAIEYVTVGPKCPWNLSELAGLMTSEGYRNFDLRRSNCQIR